MLKTTAALAAFLVGLLGVAAAVAPQPAPPSALGAAIAATSAARTAYAFDMDVQSAKLNWRTHFDPRSTPHLQLVQPTLASLNNDQRRAFDDAARRLTGVSWCASTEMGHITNVRPLREDSDTITYAFQPTRDSIRSEQARAFADRLRGEFTLTRSNPDIARVHIYAPAPFSPALLVNLTRMDVAITCVVAPNNRRYASETITEIAGSALGQAFAERTVQRTHDLAPTL
ncbi:MAG: hypothetical protein HY054_03165 [Proteobacteria bacterium]|nr:hypothetical protein [Pseudomonadota bacterium]